MMLSSFLRQQVTALFSFSFQELCVVYIGIEPNISFIYSETLNPPKWNVLNRMSIKSHFL